MRNLKYFSIAILYLKLKENLIIVPKILKQLLIYKFKSIVNDKIQKALFSGSSLQIGGFFRPN